MQTPRFPLEEFQRLFPDAKGSEEEIRREYETLLSTVQTVEQLPIPDLSAGEKVEIFETAWAGSLNQRCKETPWGNWLTRLWRQPAMTFGLGILVGCFLTVLSTQGQLDFVQTASADQPLLIEQTRNAQTYKGKLVAELFPEIEHPQVVVETRNPSSPPQRVVYGTLDAGNIYVVLNY